ncbi:MAG: acetyl-CoA carboxylase biotin carboxylase subunit [Candidatus Aminicenantia bacterium]
MIKKVLVANRGEIAIRVIKACRELGIPNVVIYSEVDRKSLHIQMADEAVEVGAAPPSESYLNMERIIEIAKSVSANAIHPGYGFLAENWRFAEMCEEEGIIFIGPNPRAMKLLGNKVESRKEMEKVGVPVIPGMKSSSTDFELFKKEAENIGYPVLIKSAGGGGGKGMRIVRSEEELVPFLESSMRESKSAFGDDSVYLEKYIEEPRHVEIQVLADNYGNVVHLCERECSLQRRYQKIVEETPSVALDDELRERMGETAKKVLKHSGYNNAGTVEFLLDKNRNFYFLEVNARVQVEHPITEMVTGVDIVKNQILIASAEKLKYKQGDIKQRGHSIECRIYAEDPENNFLPSPGKILFVKEPSGAGIRVDSGIYSGCYVPPLYDPILAKLIVWAEDRDSAIKRMKEALREYVIIGIKTTIPFLIDVMEHPDFIKGNTYTNFVDKYFKEWKESKEDFFREAMMSYGIIFYNNLNSKKEIMKKKHVYNPWLEIGPWRNA